MCPPRKLKIFYAAAFRDAGARMSAFLVKTPKRFGSGWSICVRDCDFECMMFVIACTDPIVTLCIFTSTDDDHPTATLSLRMEIKRGAYLLNEPDPVVVRHLKVNLSDAKSLRELRLLSLQDQIPIFVVNERNQLVTICSASGTPELKRWISATPSPS